MLVERIWAANELRNFHYLIACSQTGEALIVDPLDAQQCLAAARTHGFTHHAGPQHPRASAITPPAMPEWWPPPARRCWRMPARRAASAAWIAAWRAATSSRWAAPSSSRCWTRPATRARMSACWRTAMRRRCSAATRCSMPAPATATTAAIPGLLYETFVNQLAKLPDATRVYPGPRIHGAQPRLHAGSRAGQCRRGARAGRGARAEPAAARITTLGEEKRVNTFLRLQNPEIIARLREKFPEIGETARRAHRVREAARAAQSAG